VDPRVRQLAKVLVNNSVKVQAGEKVLIYAVNPEAYPLAEALVDAVYEVGGLPFYQLVTSRMRRVFSQQVTHEQLELEEKLVLAKIKEMQAFIGISACENEFEGSDVPMTKQILMDQIRKPSDTYRVNQTKWCIVQCPTSGMAQAAQMPTESFESFAYQTYFVDYFKMSQAMDPLVVLMSQTDSVRITGLNTDIRFSIKGIPVIKCCGEKNIPDGEVFTAPIRDSVNGSVFFAAPTMYRSKRFAGISLQFANGHINTATCEQGSVKDLLNILDSDEGARYLGEFAIGVNPFIKTPILDPIFDEKIVGSLHLTPGMCYDVAPNGNDSQIHWDMVCIQTPDYGGGKIYFDGVLVRKDGRFVLPELDGLNPEHLV